MYNGDEKKRGVAMEQLAKTFSENLLRERRARGLTQEALAKKIGYSEKAVSKWECGNAIPPAWALVRIADALQITMDELFGSDGDPQYFLGIDGGATKTDFMLADREGNILKRITLGSCNPVDIGIDGATKVLDEGIRLAASDVPFRKIAVFAGISGGVSGDNQKRISAFLSRFRFACYKNGSDAESLVEAGLRGEDGIAVIMGTGSVAFAVRDGVAHRIGGLGYLFDNGGNGYSLGRDAIRAAICAEDGCGEETLLCEMVKQKINAGTALSALTDFYSLGKRGIAEYAPLVFRAAKRGDRVAEEILCRNMKELATLIKTGRKLFGTEKTKVVFVGGLTEEWEMLCPLIRKHLENENAYTLTVYRDSPAFGALALARKIKRETKA